MRNSMGMAVLVLSDVLRDGGIEVRARLPSVVAVSRPNDSEEQTVLLACGNPFVPRQALYLEVRLTIQPGKRLWHTFGKRVADRIFPTRQE